MAYSDDLTGSRIPFEALRPGLRLKPLQSRGASLSDEEIDDVIAHTLAEERQLQARAALPAIASQEELAGTAGRLSRRAARERRQAEARLEASRAKHGTTRQPDGDVKTAPRLAPVEDLTPPRQGLRLGARFGFLSTKWPRRAVVAALLLGATWVWPWAVPTAILVAAVLCVAGILALGSDTTSSALIWLYHRRLVRNPVGAERMRARLDRLAMRVDEVLDRLPEGWTTGLYMADFSREALRPDEVGDDAPDPFDKLRAEAASL
ncbi:hypothetical protein ACEWPM_003400 [Roseovarius sp. S4756]|uniref:hypothetical protein n=1 Tax=Roseovarius maritimus TaxID=3342637 RepID=UPI003729C79A